MRTRRRLGQRRGLAARLAAWTLAVLVTPALVLTASPAHAEDDPFDHPMPDGNWTFVHGDAYLHYACKELIPESPYGPLYRVHTATWHNDGWTEPGVWAVITRNSNENQIHEVLQTEWLYGFAGTHSLLASAIRPDRLWMQGSYYGPTTPWDAGTPVASLATC